MKKTTPLKKQQKRAQREFYSAQRGTWNGITPTTRVVESKRVYNRKRLSREDRLSRFLLMKSDVMGLPGIQCLLLTSNLLLLTVLITEHITQSSAG